MSGTECIEVSEVATPMSNDPAKNRENSPMTMATVASPAPNTPVNHPRVNRRRLPTRSVRKPITMATPICVAADGTSAEAAYPLSWVLTIDPTLPLTMNPTDPRLRAANNVMVDPACDLGIILHHYFQISLCSLWDDCGCNVLRQLLGIAT